MQKNTLWFIIKNALFCVAATFLAIVATTLTPDSSYADTLSCNKPNAHQQLSGSLPAAEYKVYSKGISAGNAVLVQLPNACLRLEVPALVSMSHTYTYIGTITVKNSDDITMIIDGIDTSSAIIDTILLIPSSSTIRTNDDKIIGKIPTLTEEGDVTPAQFGKDITTMAVEYVTDQSLNHIDHASYYTDNKLIGTSDKPIEPISYLYANPSAKTASVEAVYKSGMKINTSVSRDSAATGGSSIWPALLWHARQASVLLLIIIFAPLAYGAYLLVRMPFRAFKKQRAYKISHGLAKPTPSLFSRVPLRYQQYLNITSTIIRYVFFGIIITVLCAYLFIDLFKVNGHSMESTLHDKSMLVVIKSDRVFSRIFGKSYMPARGEIVILKTTLTPERASLWGIQQQGTIVKRVAGLPGETVIVNGDDIKIVQTSGATIHFDEGMSWDSTRHKEDRPISLTTVLKQDEIFVVGDNRPGSIDSRFNGPYKVDDIIGRPVR